MRCPQECDSTGMVIVFVTDESSVTNTIISDDIKIHVVSYLSPFGNKLYYHLGTAPQIAHNSTSVCTFVYVCSSIYLNVSSITTKKYLSNLIRVFLYFFPLRLLPPPIYVGPVQPDVSSSSPCAAYFDDGHLLVTSFSVFHYWLESASGWRGVLKYAQFWVRPFLLVIRAMFKSQPPLLPGRHYGQRFHPEEAKFGEIALTHDRGADNEGDQHNCRGAAELSPLHCPSVGESAGNFENDGTLLTPIF